MATFDAAAKQLIASLNTAIRRLALTFGAERGYPPHALTEVALLSQLVVPLLSLLGQGWASSLPGAPKRKKKSAVEEAQADTAPSIASRDMLREGAAAVSSSLSELEAALRRPKLRSAACSLLEHAEEWEAFLGGGGEASSARSTLLASLEASGSGCTSALAASVKSGVASMRQLSKSL
uniref:Uncharacterized protein n=1 Tax=Haptolina ericina TaxID=156174 RepID=A0A7S3B360_9EUKA